MSQSLCCGFWCFLLFLYFKIKSNVPLVSYRKAYETDNITMYSNNLVTVHAKKILKKLYTFIVYRPLITASEAQCLIFMKTSSTIVGIVRRGTKSRTRLSRLRCRVRSNFCMICRFMFQNFGVWVFSM